MVVSNNDPHFLSRHVARQLRVTNDALVQSQMALLNIADGFAFFCEHLL
jgi:hypothetical protein